MLLAVFALGCDNRPARQPISGTVTVDGKPLYYGTITFEPEVRGPRAAASIRDGKYEIESSRGPLSGPTLVVIRSPKFPHELSLPEDTSELADLALQYTEALPARYNAKTELQAIVTDEGPNEFNFELTSQ
jgi:hypothetical protein